MPFSDLLGKTLVHCAKGEDETGQDEIRFTTSEGVRYRLTHWRDCCESVRVEDVAGDLEALRGDPLLMAEEAVQERDDSADQTWTFYKLATVKEYVTIRWLGESNGYYSERVDFERWNPNTLTWDVA